MNLANIHLFSKTTSHEWYKLKMYLEQALSSKGKLQQMHFNSIAKHDLFPYWTNNKKPQ